VKTFFYRCSNSGINESTPHTKYCQLDIKKSRTRNLVVEISLVKKASESGPKIDPATGVSPVIKGGPEPLKNEINKILGSKREDRFSDHFPDLVQNICSVRFSYLLRLSIFCKGPRTLRKFPQKCQKIAGC